MTDAHLSLVLNYVKPFYNQQQNSNINQFENILKKSAMHTFSFFLNNFPHEQLCGYQHYIWIT